MIPALALQEALDAKKPGRLQWKNSDYSISRCSSRIRCLDSISILWSNDPMIQWRCISHSNASRWISTSLGPLCGSRQQGLRQFSFFHRLHDRAANCVEWGKSAGHLVAQQQGSWEVCWWKFESHKNSVKSLWWNSFRLSPRQSQKVRWFRVFGVFDTSSQFRGGIGRWNRCIEKWWNMHSQYLKMPADSVILDLQYSGCLVIIASLYNGPLSWISRIGLRIV